MNVPNGDFEVEIIDYGFTDGRAPNDSEVVASIDATGKTHNLRARPAPGTAILYLVNEHHDESGLEIWDVSNLVNPSKIQNAAPTAGLHDIEIEVGAHRMRSVYIFGKMIAIRLKDTYCMLSRIQAARRSLGTLTTPADPDTRPLG